MNKVLIFTLLIFSSAFANKLGEKKSAEKITIYTTEISKINTRDQSGYYNNFLKMFEKTGNFKFNVQFFPSARGVQNFYRNSKSCFFPFTIEDIKKAPKGLIFSKPIGELELYGISKKESPLITSKTDIKNKSVALRTLYKESVSFDKSKKFFFVESEKQLYYMLDRKRIDYILESVPDVYLFFKNGKKDFDKLYHFDPSLKLKVLKDYFACHGESKIAKKLINHINNQLSN